MCVISFLSVSNLCCADVSANPKLIYVCFFGCQELSMPCDQYELHLQDGVVGSHGNPDVAVASLDQSISTVTAIQLGHINVVLDHKSILKNLTLL